MSHTRVSFHGVGKITAEATSHSGTHWVSLRFDDAEIVAFLPNAALAKQYADSINSVQTATQEQEAA